MGEWLGVMASLVWKLRQTDEGIQYQVFGMEQDVTRITDDKDNVQTDKIDLQKRCRRKRELIVPRHSIQTEKSESQGLNMSPETEPRKKQRKSAKNAQGLKATESLNTFCIHGAASKLEDPSKNLKLSADIKDNALLQSQSIEDRSHLVLLRDYFQMDVDLEKLYCDWSKRDPHFCKVASKFKGIRILRQDPTENLLSFVCSSNNHISRIASMVEKLCCHYGKLITELDGEKYYSVPSFQSLSGDEVESHLRQLGFGYRAKFISSIAKFIVEQKDVEWLDSLRHQNYDEAKNQLLTLMGVGPKVADCVCLMSLDKPGAVPVDTHVWQITLSHYMAQLKTAKSLTDKIYNEIGDFYRGLWGPYAGWAHSVLFTADLKQNKAGPNSSKDHSGESDNSSTS